MSAVADGKVITFHYTLTDDDGAVLDSSRERGQPMPYLHGARNIVPGLERQMTGKVVGDTFDARVPAAEAYGERHDVPMQPVPKSEFPPNIPLQVGIQLMARDDQGNAQPIWIGKIEGDTVYIDLNHPMAGKNLNFAIEITGIRDATAEEVAHGHSHGPDGTHSH